MLGSTYFGTTYFGPPYFGTELPEIGPTGGVPTFIFHGVSETRIIIGRSQPAIFTAPFGQALMDNHVAPEILTKHPSATRIVSVLFDERLASGDTLTGTPTVSLAVGSGLTLGTPSINAAAAVINGERRAAGTIITFAVSGGTDEANYIIDVVCSTVNGEVLVIPCRVEVRDGEQG